MDFIPEHAPRRILFVTRIPPKKQGHGGSQRALHLLNGLLLLGTVDVLYVHAPGDKDASNDALEEARELAEHAIQLALSDWIQPNERWPWLSWKAAQAMYIATGTCHEAPRLPAAALRRIQHALPRQDYDIVVAGRLPCAVIVDAMLDQGLIRTRSKIVDLDDIMSRFKERELITEGPRQGKLWSLALRADIRRVRRAEAQVVRSWDAASLCSHDDVELLRQTYPDATVTRVPNVIDRPLLPVNADATGRRLLFVGSLAFRANVAGLRAFVDEAWPRIRDKLPDARLDVVGMLPPEGLKEEMASVGIDVHANVPSVEPFYREADIVISPILFGGGTRIKILEAMAYGRPIVSTAIGAEGLELETGRHALVVETMAEFAEAVVLLSTDAALRAAIAADALVLQHREYGPAALERALHDMAAG